MKVNAITGNGTRVKDFMDIYFLLKEFTMGDIIGFYAEKYEQRNTFHALKSLTYFEDVDTNAWPNMLLEKSLIWKQITATIIRHRDKFLKDK